jgi:2-methylcitrate dehydratase PrpD
MALAAKVEIRHDPAITAKGPRFRQMVRVEVFLNDGAKLERTLEVSRRKETFASRDEVVSKFENLATHVLPRPQVESLRDAMLNLDELKSAAELARLMQKR